MPRVLVDVQQALSDTEVCSREPHQRTLRRGRSTGRFLFIPDQNRPSNFQQSLVSFSEYLELLAKRGFGVLLKSLNGQLSRRRKPVDDVEDTFGQDGGEYRNRQPVRAIAIDPVDRIV